MYTSKDTTCVGAGSECDAVAELADYCLSTQTKKRLRDRTKDSSCLASAETLQSRGDWAWSGSEGRQGTEVSDQTETQQVQ